MFSALSQGSSIYLLDKTSSPKFIIGEVVGVTQPKYNFSQATVDLKVKVDDSIQAFNNLIIMEKLLLVKPNKVYRMKLKLF